MGLVPDERRLVECDICGYSADTRLFRYWFVLIGQRGKVPKATSADHPDRRLRLCGPCGDVLNRELELYLAGHGLDYFARGVVRD